ncbi:glycosyltransferase [Xanthobacter autotrophicus]|uniref:glycosyltransferase n=1 Tax=Xanthobacter autotrophicus TaxID=280 RepID=UPI003726B2A2
MNERIKILHVCESIVGGTGSYLCELIPHQVAKYGAENVGLLVPENQLAHIEPQVSAAMPTIFTFKRPGRPLGSLFLVERYLRSIRTFKPDIVHAHSSVAGVVVRLLAIRRNFGIVFCPHGWSVDMKGARYIKNMTAGVERALGPIADKTIVISQYEYDRAAEIGIPMDKVQLVLSGIDPQVPTIEPAEWNDERLRVLFAGRYDYQKGLDVLLKAVEGLEDKLSVRIVGGAAVDRIVLPETLPANVADMGWLDRNGVYAQMKACDVLVIPSRWEGFGLVAIEAMRLAVPVLASAVGGLKEIMGNGKYGLVVPPEDPAALRACLEGLTLDALRRLGKVGRERFFSCYKSDRMNRETDEVYAGIVAKAGPICRDAG